MRDRKASIECGTVAGETTIIIIIRRCKKVWGEEAIAFPMANNNPKKVINDGSCARVLGSGCRLVGGRCRSLTPP